jgi:2-dehydro-3-deoxyphosphogluconate aldolase/(4S)-4-hydroxy-2-oxoglutarate aldolase
MPTGGVAPTKENLKAWFEAGVTCVGMGSKLISNDIIARRAYDELQIKVTEALALIRQLKSG